MSHLATSTSKDDRNCRHQEARPDSREGFIAGILSAKQLKRF
jgi:hypothetical protein